MWSYVTLCQPPYIPLLLPITFMLSYVIVH
nr:MAG TPA: hypothetical protein [Caudoviricetes sp.]